MSRPQPSYSMSSGRKGSSFSTSPNRGRSLSPTNPLFHHTQRSPDTSKEEALEKELKWSITNHDPSERLKHPSGDHRDDEISDEEQISDDEAKFEYDDTGNILPNYATSEINEVSKKLEKDLKVERIDQLKATERALANAKIVGSPVDHNMLKDFENDKFTATGEVKIDLSKIDQDDKERKEKLKEYSLYKKKLITNTNPLLSPTRPKSPLSDDDPMHDDKNFLIPYTSDIEEKLDSELATKLNSTIKESPIDSNKENHRCIKTITRGDFFKLIKLTPTKKPKMFLVCMDFSPESIFALEWCIGTVLVDGSVLFIVYVIEESDNHQKTNASVEKEHESTRINYINRTTEQVLNLLKLTKLQIHVVIEVIHHPIPRHLITEIIDNLKPTLVVVGSKGQSAIKGVLLGSLSNYLVTKSTVPVMVVREKLKKINKNRLNPFNNNIKGMHKLSQARVD